MPKKGGGSTPQERKFVEAYVATQDARYSATQAGFAQPRSAGYKALSRPAVQAEIARLQQERLFQEVLPLAVEVHIDMMRDSKTPAGARAQLVKLAYDRTFGSQEGAQAKEPHEMTAEEIADTINKLEQVAALRAKPAQSAQDAPNVFE